MKKVISIIAALFCVISLISCGVKTSENSETVTYAAGDSAAGDLTMPDAEYPDDVAAGSETFSSVGAEITLDDSGISVNGTGASASGSVLTVSSAGSYLISGTLTDGQIVVDTEDDEAVELILSGVSISNSTSAPVYVINASKNVSIYLSEGSVNILSDGSSRSDELTELDAAIYSKEDLKIKGSGSLYVTGNYSKGIVSKDDLEVKDGNVFITSADDALVGKDSVVIEGGNIVISAGDDGIKSNNDEDEGMGTVTVSGGSVSIVSSDDGINAVGEISVTGGSIIIEAGGGYTNAAAHSDNMGGFGGRGVRQSSVTSSEAEAKGISSDSVITISGGTLSINSSDDAIHADDTVTIDGSADVYVQAGDDGVHGGSYLYVKGGTTVLAASYEGFEANKIYISGGTNLINASDDGMNASGGSTSTGGFGGWGMSAGTGSTASSDSPLLSISGGYSIVNAAGDGIDSNGNIEMSGGTMIVFGPTDNGNGAVDTGDGNYGMTISGGTLLAVGSSGMAESATGDGQYVIATNVNINAGTTAAICDSDGNALLVFENPKAVQNLVFSSPDLVSGDTYTIYTGGSCSGTLENNVYTGGSYTKGSSAATATASASPSSGGMGGMPGGMPGGMNGGMGGGMGGGRGGW